MKPKWLLFAAACGLILWATYALVLAPCSMFRGSLRTGEAVSQYQRAYLDRLRRIEIGLNEFHEVHGSFPASMSAWIQAEPSTDSLDDPIPFAAGPLVLNLELMSATERVVILAPPGFVNPCQPDSVWRSWNYGLLNTPPNLQGAYDDNDLARTAVALETRQGIKTTK